MLLTMVSASAPAADATDALIQRLARPAPASVAFTEVRFSRLLRAPLIVSGQLSYDGPLSLQRQVDHPYREVTTIEGESVRVEREGEQPRSFGLKRAPELRGLLSGFSALLSGDAAVLRRDFDIARSGDDASWTLQLTPSDARARRRLQGITVTGHQDEPSCMQMLTADGATSVLLLGAAAVQPVPEDITAPALQLRCAAPIARDGNTTS